MNLLTCGVGVVLQTDFPSSQLPAVPAAPSILLRDSSTIIFPDSFETWFCWKGQGRGIFRPQSFAVFAFSDGLSFNDANRW